MKGCNAPDHRPARRVLGGILVFASVARLLYLYGYRSDPFASSLLHDARQYDAWARALASGETWEPGAFYQAPLYPYLVSLAYRVAGPEPMVVYGLQCLLGVLTVLLVFIATRRAYGSRAGLVAAAVSAVYRPFVFHETKLLPAAVGVFLVALAVERFQAADATRRGSAWLGAGAVAGLAGLTNPVLLLLAAFAAAWIGLDGSRPWPDRLRRAAWLAVGAALVVAPVTARNHVASGDWVPISANGGITFAHGNNPNARGVFSTPPGISGAIDRQREESRRVAESETGRRLGDAEVSAFWFRRGLRFVREDPIRWLGLTGAKLLLAFADEEQPLEYNVRLDANRFRWLFPLPFAVVLALASLRVFGRPDNPRTGRAEQPLLLLLVTVTATLVVF